MILIQHAKVYTPFYVGEKDIWIAGGKIEKIADHLDEVCAYCDVIDGSGMIVTPGLMDRHIHITGGGGEGGFFTQVPPVQLSALIRGGITTAIGLLGTDGLTRNIENLIAKAKSLCAEGISVYCMTGSYGYPSITLTDSVGKDILFIDPIIGCKLALSDHRSSHITVQELISLASQVRTAGMLAGKAGILTLHMGDEPNGLEPVFDALKQTSIPITLFQPTHVQRNERLLHQAFDLAHRGGIIDLTCGMNVLDALKQAKAHNVPWNHLTLSSDGQGSWSTYDDLGHLESMGVSAVDGIYKEICHVVKSGDISFEEMLQLCTLNVAKALRLYPQKGTIQTGSDADVLLWNGDMNLDTVIAKGQVLMKEGKVLKKGVYEE